MRRRAFVFALAILGADRLARAETTPAEPTADVSPPPAADKPIVVWPTLTPAGDDAGGVALHIPGVSEGGVYARALELDATLRDAVQDLGFSLDIADAGP